jgi:hypothetical protein
MTIETSTLRPGLLVSLSLSLTGNVDYAKRIIEEAHITAEGTQKAKWETVRTIIDPVEHEAGTKARQKAGALIRAACAPSAFGLLCPEDRTDKLEAAIAAGRKVAEEFNATAKLSRVSLYVLTGRIAQDDVEAVRAINSEVRELMEEMQQGLKNLDVKVVRDAATRAKGIGAMLSPEAQARVQLAVDAARESAKQIVKAGEQSAVAIDQATIKKIAEQRTAFLDLDDAQDVAAPAADARALDLAPIETVAPVAPARPALEVE